MRQILNSECNKKKHSLLGMGILLGCLCMGCAAGEHAGEKERLVWMMLAGLFCSMDALLRWNIAQRKSAWREMLFPSVSG